MQECLITQQGRQVSAQPYPKTISVLFPRLIFVIVLFSTMFLWWCSPLRLMKCSAPLPSVEGFARELLRDLGAGFLRACPRDIDEELFDAITP